MSERMRNRKRGGVRTRVTVTHERLLAVLHYEPSTGAFTWKASHNGRVRVGQRAGSANKDGYIQIKIDRRLYGAHRLAWFYSYGKWPESEIDHRHGDITDNRISELRQATRSQQMSNLRRPRTNTSGYKGASFHKKSKRWRASIHLNGKPKHLGYFQSAEAAHAAYVAAALRKSGEFARAA